MLQYLYFSSRGYYAVTVTWFAVVKYKFKKKCPRLYTFSPDSNWKHRNF